MECGGKRAGSSLRASCRGCKMGRGYSIGFKGEIPRLYLGSVSLSGSIRVAIVIYS
jgi:hypothetical protein